MNSSGVILWSSRALTSSFIVTTASSLVIYKDEWKVSLESHNDTPPHPLKNAHFLLSHAGPRFCKGCGRVMLKVCAALRGGEIHICVGADRTETRRKAIEVTITFISQCELISHHLQRSSIQLIINRIDAPAVAHLSVWRGCFVLFHTNETISEWVQTGLKENTIEINDLCALYRIDIAHPTTTNSDTEPFALIFM